MKLGFFLYKLGQSDKCLGIVAKSHLISIFGFHLSMLRSNGLKHLDLDFELNVVIEEMKICPSSE